MSRVTLLGETGTRFPGSIISLSGNAMHLYIQGAIPVGGLLKVETARAMYLGEVAAIWPQPSDGYTAVLMFVEHMLPSCVRPESSQRSAA